jgi:hypothetical protein
MKIDEANHIINQVYSDPPTIEHPCVAYVQSLLLNLDSNTEDAEDPLERFVELIATELEVTKSAFWCYEKEVFEKLAFSIEVFLIDCVDKIKQQTKDHLRECLLLLNFISEGKDNLNYFPDGYDEIDPRTLVVRADIWRKVKNKFNNPNIKCPSCEHEFSQVAFDVVRTMYAVKCPKCKQSISL